MVVDEAAFSRLEKGLRDLVSVVRTLRGPDGCPWDREQTFRSLIEHIIEEAYEVVDAIESDEWEALREELGDVLLHVVMLSEMAREQGYFVLDDVIDAVTQKMVRRHPHVFGSEKVDSVEGVWRNWEKIKETERGKKSESVLASVPKQLPALMKAMKVQKKVARMGLECTELNKSVDQVSEEIQGVSELALGSDERVGRVGQALFSLVAVSKKMGVNPEQALADYTKTFMNRFEQVESRLADQRLQFSDLSSSDLEAFWIASKQENSLT